MATVSDRDRTRQYPKVSDEAKTHPEMIWALVLWEELTEDEAEEFTEGRKTRPDIYDFLHQQRLPSDPADYALRITAGDVVTENALAEKGCFLALQGRNMFIGCRFEGTAAEREYVRRRVQTHFLPRVEARIGPLQGQTLRSIYEWGGLDGEDEIGVADLDPCVLADFEYPRLSCLHSRQYVGPRIPIDELIRRAEVEEREWDAANWFREICFDCGYSRQEAIQAIDGSEYAGHPNFVYARRLIQECYDFRFVCGERKSIDQMHRGDDRYTAFPELLRRTANDVTTRVVNGAVNDTVLEFAKKIAARLNEYHNDPPLSPAEVERIVQEFDDPLPEILTTNRPLRDMTTDANEALTKTNFPLRLFVRNGQLVERRRDERGNLFLSAVDVDALRRLMTESANYIAIRTNGRRWSTVHVAPPKDVAKDILAQAPARLGFPPLAGIVESPVVRPDGTILSEPGYDPETRLYFDLGPSVTFPEIPNSPTDEQVRDAVDLISGELLRDFPFKDQADRANCFAALLTPLLRPTIQGCVPLFLVNSPQPGTGKGLLASIISRIVSGHPGSISTAPNSDEEWRKRITSFLLHGSSIVILDNVESVLDSPSLAALVTTTQWQDRILGKSESANLKNNTTWFVTGNNVQLAGDLSRRTVWIRIDAQTACPWSRTDFRHPDLETWASENRPKLVAALLTIVRAWFVAGRPPATDDLRLGSFRNWCEIVGGILRHAGISGFLQNFNQAFDEADEDALRWERLLESLHCHFADEEATTTRRFTSREAISAIAADEDVLPDVVIEARSQLYRDQVVATRALGRAFRRVVDRRFGRYRIVRAETDTGRRVASWQIIMEMD